MQRSKSPVRAILADSLRQVDLFRDNFRIADDLDGNSSVIR